MTTRVEETKTQNQQGAIKMGIEHESTISRSQLDAAKVEIERLSVIIEQTQSACGDAKEARMIVENENIRLANDNKHLREVLVRTTKNVERLQEDHDKWMATTSDLSARLVKVQSGLTISTDLLAGCLPETQQAARALYDKIASLAAADRAYRAVLVGFTRAIPEGSIGAGPANPASASASAPEIEEGFTWAAPKVGSPERARENLQTALWRKSTERGEAKQQIQQTLDNLNKGE